MRCIQCLIDMIRVPSYGRTGGSGTAKVKFGLATGTGPALATSGARHSRSLNVGSRSGFLLGKLGLRLGPDALVRAASTLSIKKNGAQDSDQESYDRV